MRIKLLHSTNAISLLFCSLIAFVFTANKLSAQQNGDEKYPYWGAYNKTPISDIKAAKWISKDKVALGWDWSLPPSIKAAAKSNLCLARNGGLNPEKTCGGSDKLSAINRKH